MHFFVFLAILLPIIGGIAASSVSGNGTKSLNALAIPDETYQKLVYYYQYASSAYVEPCANPNGNTLVTVILNNETDTHGFIALDTKNKQIVVAFRGTVSQLNVETDLDIKLVAFDSSGVNAPSGTKVHRGFLKAWNSVAAGVISVVGAKLTERPGYSIVTTGHSLGGALSSLAGIALKQNYPGSDVHILTYGQPRTGNTAYATFVNDQVDKENLYRGVHTDDNVPTIPPRLLGYSHHGTEYWSYLDPSSPATTRKCNPTAGKLEDETCRLSLPGGIEINPAHDLYYNIPIQTPFCT